MGTPKRPGESGELAIVMRLRDIAATVDTIRSPATAIIALC
jgi:hypothetical protein